MKKIKDVSIIDYKYQKQSIVKGYYYLVLDIDYEDNTNDKLNKRYSQIKELYKILILTNPGCLIPRLKKRGWNFNIIKKEKSKTITTSVEKFLLHLIKHPILIKNKSVLDFFSKENKEINKNQTLKTKKMDKIIENDEEENDNDNEFNNDNSIKKDLYSSSEENENTNKNNKEMINEFEIIEKEDYKDLFEEQEENELLNMFIEEELNNKNKGFLTNITDFFISMYKYETKNNQNQEVYEFINSNSSILGEDIEVNKYGVEIMRINEGVEYILNNLIKINELIDKKAKSLDNIVEIFQEIQNINNKKKEEANKTKEEKTNNDFQTVENDEVINNENEKERENKEKNTKEKWDKKLLNGEINKIKYYSSINQNYIMKDLNLTIDKIIELKDTLEGLCDIFERKKSHIQFLTKLQTQLNEIKKQNELIKENDENKNQLKDDKSLKKKIDKEILHINKLNQNLKYEIDKFKKEQGYSIYTLINDLYKNNYLKQCDIFDIINKEISFDSDSENSSKIKGENGSENSSSQFLIVDDININEKKEKDKEINKNKKENDSWDNDEDEF